MFVAAHHAGTTPCLLWLFSTSASHAAAITPVNVRMTVNGILLGCLVHTVAAVFFPFLQATSEDSGGSRARQWLRLLLDFFTGKYLYDTWRKSSSGSGGSGNSSSAAGAGGCPFARLHGGGTGAANAQAAAAAGCPAHKHAAAAAAGGSDQQGLHEE